jgi:hypothetical protein
MRVPKRNPRQEYRLKQHERVACHTLLLYKLNLSHD